MKSKKSLHNTGMNHFVAGRFDLAYVYANEIISNSATSSVETTIAAEHLRNRALCGIMPQKLLIDKSTALHKKALDAIWDEKNPVRAVKMLQEAKRLYLTVGVLLELGKVFEELEKYADAYVHISEALSRSGTENVDDVKFLKRQLIAAMRGNGLQPSRIRFVPCIITMRNVSPNFNTSRWPTNLRISSLRIIFAKTCRISIRKMDGGELYPMVPYEQLSSFITHNVARIDNVHLDSTAGGVGGIFTDENGCENMLQDLLRSVPPERFHHCYNVELVGLFHAAHEWARIIWLFENVLSGKRFTIIGFHVPDWRCNQSTVFIPEDLLSTRGLTDCDRLVMLPLQSAAVLHAASVYDYYARSRFITERLLAWLKEKRGRMLTIATVYLAEEVWIVVDEFQKDFLGTEFDFGHVYYGDPNKYEFTLHLVDVPPSFLKRYCQKEKSPTSAANPSATSSAGIQAEKNRNGESLSISVCDDLRSLCIKRFMQNS